MLSTFFAAICLFSPPEQWEMSDPKTPSRHAICGFLDKSQVGFCPSIHLTCETLSVTEEEYFKKIEQNAKAKRHTWRNIGELKTKSGPAKLIQLGLDTPLGRVQLMQAILIRNHEAHILTAGALKRDFPRLASKFKAAFSSMEIVDNLLDRVEEPGPLKAAWKKRGEDLEFFQARVMEQDALGPVEKIQLMRLQ